SSTDITRIRKYLAGAPDTEISDGADANGDGKISTVDLTRLRKCLAGVPGVFFGPTEDRLLIVSSPDRTVFNKGEEVSFSGLKCALRSGGVKTELSAGDLAISSCDYSVVNVPQTITVSYNGLSTSFKIKIITDGQMPVGITKGIKGAAATMTGTLLPGNLNTLKAGGINAIKIHIPYPFDAEGRITSEYIMARNAVINVKNSGLEPICQSFTPGGNAYDAEADDVVWNSYIPGDFTEYGDDYYNAVAAGCRHIASELAPYCSCWMVSNEPNISVYTGPMTDEEIIRYINTSAIALKQGAPGISCGINVFGPADHEKAQMLVQALYTRDSALDWLGLDSYFGTLVQGTPYDWENYINAYFSLVHVPIMITEFSYSSYVYDASLVNTDGHKHYNSPVCRDKQFSYEWTGRARTEETQAEYARVCLEIFDRHPEVIGCCWFSNIDKNGPCWECGEAGCPMESSWGLLHSDGTAKPVLGVFAE
ncbi:MAG: hypothetical protein IJL71_05475, partial [Oscillospiraceae bacterium]|nr:hypothetical protein [Oscillospiraceae bacterium]